MALVASITHAVLQIYLEKLTHGRFSGSFFEFIPHYLDGVYLSIGARGNFAFHGMHLWYLLLLFCYSLLCYPLFEWFSDNGQAVLRRACRLISVPGVICFWFSLPLLLIKLFVPEAVLMAGAGGWSFLYYLWFLIAGGIIISDERFQQAIKHQRWMSLGLGLVLSAVYLLQLCGPSGQIFPPGYAHWIEPTLGFFSAW